MNPLLSVPVTRLFKLWVHALFWPWNLCFLAIIAFGYVPLALVDLVADALDGLARWDFVASSLVLVFLPLVVTLQALRGLRKNSSDLALVFFGVELPVFFFVAARLFGFQDLSGAARFVVVALMVGGLGALVRVLMSARVASSPLLTLLVHALLAVLVVAGSYVSFLLALWTLPTFVTVVVEVCSGLVQMFGREEFGVATVMGFFVAIVPALWGLLTLLVLLLLPVAAPLTWLRLLWRSFQAVATSWPSSRSLPVAATVAPVMVLVVAFALLLPQPNETAFPRLKAVLTTDAQRQALLNDREMLRAGLVDAYLSHRRYLGDVDSDLQGNAWARAWRPFLAEARCEEIAEVAMAAARPFVFQGSEEDRRNAGRWYRAFFGRDLERDNADEVKDTLAATWSREERYAGFINEGERRVRLVRQDVSTQATGGVVDVEVHDEWTNLTPDDAEVALFFELPETAALTGLSLSPSGNKAEAFPFVVAPRGAAQQVYNEQVQQRRDPALLEQVGPRQYRLRVFPVPAKHIDRDRGGLLPTSPDGWRNAQNQPRQHVWMSYQALVDGDGNVPLPRLSERRNGFWDTHSVRKVNGADVNAVDGDHGGDWVQGRVTAAPTSTLTLASAGSCFRFTRTAAPAVHLVGQTVDVVIDRSLAMESQRAALAQALTSLQQTGATLRYVLGTSSLRNEEARVVDVVNTKDLLFFGSASVKELVHQARLRTPASTASMLLILTAQGSFDVADDTALDAQSLALARTVVVHLGGKFPAGYDDHTLDAIRRSGGSAVANIDEGLSRLAGVSWVDGVLIQSCAAQTATPSELGSKMLARQQILEAERGGQPDAAALDVLHAVARAAGVVTPYSSMICLADEAQRQRLKELEAQKDRFDREVENGTKVPGPQSSLFDVSGVPEPQDWLLVIVGCVAVFMMTRRRGREQARELT